MNRRRPMCAACSRMPGRVLYKREWLCAVCVGAIVRLTRELVAWQVAAERSAARR